MWNEKVAYFAFRLTVTHEDCCHPPGWTKMMTDTKQLYAGNSGTNTLLRAIYGCT